MIYKINKNNITDDYNINSFKELKENYIYDLGFADLSQLLKDFEYQKELNDVSYSDLVNNIFIYLNKEKKENKKNNFDIICLNLLIDLLSTKKDLFNEYYSNEEKKEKMKKLFIKLFSDNDKDKSKFFINYLDKKKNTAMANENYNYIIFLYKLCNSLLNNLITVQSQLEEKDDKEKIEIFTPQSEFFDLYNNLNQSVENLVNAKIMTKNEIENESESFSNKIYDLLMKELTNDNKEENSTKNKIILNFLKLLEISVNKDENKTNAILLEKNKTSNVSLFDLIYQKYFSTLCSKGGGEKNSTEDHTELISKSEDENKTDKNENEENNKFILLEEIKQTKPEDDSINEELNKYYSEIIFNALSYSNSQALIPKLISVINILKKLSKKEKNGNDSDSDDRESPAMSIYHHHSSKKQHDHVGLKNLGCICYLNSTMQQMYMVPTFRRAIMWSDDNKEANPTSNYRYSCEDDNLLHQLQEMYTYLTFSEKMDYNPRGFCYSFKDFDGNPINIAAQQDSQEFLNNFCDKIENSLKPTKFKYIVSDVFTGKTCSSVICDKCKHISNRFEDFYTLTLEVKNINTLNDSLHKLIVPEIIDEFKCSNCNQNVRISKITSLNKLPNV